MVGPNWKDIIGEMKLDERGICDQCSVVGTKNRAIESTDSTLDAISVRDGNGGGPFPCVYIHESMVHRVLMREALGTGSSAADKGRGYHKVVFQTSGRLLDGHIK